MAAAAPRAAQAKQEREGHGKADAIHERKIESSRREEHEETKEEDGAAVSSRGGDDKPRCGRRWFCPFPELPFLKKKSTDAYAARDDDARLKRFQPLSGERGSLCAAGGSPTLANDDDDASF